MKVWVDMTASAHVLVFRPLIALLRERGDEVEITAREYAQTLQLIELHGLEATVIGRHGGRSRLGKARSLYSRLHDLRRWARDRDFDLALAHGSHELTVTARRLGIPSSTTHDYEFATLQHQLGMRAATRVVVPEAIPPERLERFGVTPPKLQRYPRPQGGVLPLRLRARRLRTRCTRGRPRSRSRRASPTARRLALPPAFEPPFPQTLDYLGAPSRGAGGRAASHHEQRAFVRNLDLPSLIVPERAVDAQSLIALADVVVSAGGTMNREAAALGVPVYTTYGGRLGGVDEELIREGRLKPLTDPRALDLVKRGSASEGRPPPRSERGARPAADGVGLAFRRGAQRRSRGDAGLE